MILQKATDLVHPFMQNGNDADIAVAQPLPVNVVPFVVEDIAVRLEFRGNRVRKQFRRLRSPRMLRTARLCTHRPGLSPTASECSGRFLRSGGLPLPGRGPMSCARPCLAPRDDVRSRQRIIGVIRRREGTCQFSFQALESLPLRPFLVAPNQVAMYSLIFS